VNRARPTLFEMRGFPKQRLASDGRQSKVTNIVRGVMSWE